MSTQENNATHSIRLSCASRPPSICLFVALSVFPSNLIYNPWVCIYLGRVVAGSNPSIRYCCKSLEMSKYSTPKSSQLMNFGRSHFVGPSGRVRETSVDHYKAPKVSFLHFLLLVTLQLQV